MASTRAFASTSTVTTFAALPPPQSMPPSTPMLPLKDYDDWNTGVGCDGFVGGASDRFGVGSGGYGGGVAVDDTTYLAQPGFGLVWRPMETINNPIFSIPAPHTPVSTTLHTSGESHSAGGENAEKRGRSQAIPVDGTIFGGGAKKFGSGLSRSRSRTGRFVAALFSK